jgi:methionine synthase II (cobalamin-independent)
LVFITESTGLWPLITESKANRNRKETEMTQAEFNQLVNQDIQRLVEKGAAEWEAQQRREAAEAEARRVEWLQVQRQNHYLSMTGQIGVGG